MNKEYSFLYRYLERLKIFIDKNEFEIQIQSHPDCPSLLAITDVLSFFNIQNGVLQVDSSQIELLPDSFVAILNGKNKDAQFSYIEKKGVKYIYEDTTKNSISKTELESQWSGVVLLIEKSDINRVSKVEVNKWLFFVMLVLLYPAVILLEYSGLYVLKSLVAILLIAFLTIIFNYSLKYLVLENAKYSGCELRSSQFINNYEAFKDALIASSPVLDTLEESTTILIGNKEAKLKIILVTNPFSGHCKETHVIIEKILEKYFDLVCIDIRFNFNSNEYSSKKSKKIHQHLVALYRYQGQKGFIEGLSNWFKNKDENKLYLMQEVISEQKINKILSCQFNFNLENELIFTPQFVINNYRFPKQYDQKKILHFIKDLSEDKYLNNLNEKKT